MKSRIIGTGIKSKASKIILEILLDFTDDIGYNIRVEATDVRSLI